LFETTGSPYGEMGIDASIGLRSKGSPAEPEPLPIAGLMGVEDEEEERFYIP
jgi:hypothetical protein